jgi:FixJ family two-component response regulator
MPDATSTVLVIDDDPELRASVGRLLRSVGVTVQLFGSIADFLGSDPPDGPTCLVLDVRLPGQSGLDLQREIVIHVARGRLNKQVAHDTGIAEATVKVHRSRAMQKMKAGSLLDLGRMADKHKLVPDTPQRS